MEVQEAKMGREYKWAEYVRTFLLTLCSLKSALAARANPKSRRTACFIFYTQLLTPLPSTSRELLILAFFAFVMSFTQTSCTSLLSFPLPLPTWWVGEDGWN